MTLSQERLEAALKPRPVHFYEQLDSTNDVALAWIRAGKPHGALFVADEQISGRGRLGRSWYAPPGTALMFSLTLPPQPDLSAHATMLGAVVVGELLERLGISGVGIKWPNDVQIDGHKVCGVLPEAVWAGDRLVGLALGVGLNVRINFSGTALADKAISIENVSETPVDRLDLLVYLLERIEYWAARADMTVLRAAWQARLNMLGQRVTVTTPAGSMSGTAVTVDEYGALLLRLDTGEDFRAVAGDIAIGAQE